MKKRIIRIGALVLLLSLTVTFAACSAEKINEKTGKLYYNGKLIDDGIVLIDSQGDRAIIPVLKVLENGGYCIEWKSETEAVITGGEKTLNLDLSVPRLTVGNGGTNLLISPPGTVDHIMYVKEKEIYIDAHSFKANMNTFAGGRYKADVDFEGGACYLICE